MTDAEYGILGSAVYIGLITGSFLSGYIFMKIKTKLVLLISIIGFILMLIVFVITDNKTIIIISRIFAGFF